MLPSSTITEASAAPPPAAADQVRAVITFVMLHTRDGSCFVLATF
jgi:hypothetical protein